MAKEIRETLERLFQVVISEAEQNPAFAQRLGEAIGQRHEAGHREPKPARRSAFDPSQLHAVNTLRLHGEAARQNRQLVLGPDFLGSIHLQHDFVGEPVRHEVHDDGEPKRRHKPL